MIQTFFTRMRCNFCSHPFVPEDIQLLRQDDGVYVVNVYCNHCRTQNGVAVVGVEAGSMDRRVTDRLMPHPDFTEGDIRRLSEFKPVSADDVLDAHSFFNTLGDDWNKFIPSEMRKPEITIQTESPDE
jgi:hypothetical protein